MAVLRKEYPEINKNFRDLGGAGPVRFGMMYRGGMNGGDLTKLGSIGVTAEISLTDKGDDNDKWNRNGLKNLQFRNQADWHNASNTQKGVSLTQCMKWVLEGKRVYIHCDRGCDRTGEFCWMIEGILGASKEEIAADYAFSDTKGNGYHIKGDETYSHGLKKATHIGGSTPGTEFQNKFINYVVNTYKVDRTLITKFISYAGGGESAGIGYFTEKTGTDVSGDASATTPGTSSGTSNAGTVSGEKPNTARPIMASCGSNTVYKMSGTTKNKNNILQTEEKRRDRFGKIVEEYYNSAPESGRKVIVSSEFFGAEILKTIQDAKKYDKGKSR